MRSLGLEETENGMRMDPNRPTDTLTQTQTVDPAGDQIRPRSDPRGVKRVFARRPILIEVRCRGLRDSLQPRNEFYSLLCLREPCDPTQLPGSVQRDCNSPAVGAARWLVFGTGVHTSNSTTWTLQLQILEGWIWSRFNLIWEISASPCVAICRPLSLIGIG